MYVSLLFILYPVISFNSSIKQPNLLPFDGALFYYGPVFSNQIADSLFNTLLKDITWEQDRVVMFGKERLLTRKVAWFGDPGLHYTYAGIRKQPTPWNDCLNGIRSFIESHIGHTFNSCLLNHYASGQESMSWHSDNEKELLPNGAIASVSFGAERRFLFKHRRTGHKIELLLEHGSILLMNGEIQRHWLHALPKMTRVQAPRINLTFRTIQGT